MFGHAVELTDASAPAHIIRIHVLSMRQVEHVLHAWMGKINDVVVSKEIASLTAKPHGHEDARKRYRSLVKSSGGIINTAYLLKHNMTWGGGWFSWNKGLWCWDISMSVIWGYGHTIVPCPKFFAFLCSLITLAFGHSETVTAPFRKGGEWAVPDFTRKPQCAETERMIARTHSIFLSVSLGMSMIAPAGLFVGFFLSFAVTPSVTECEGLSVIFSVSAGSSGGVFLPGWFCMFGPSLFGRSCTKSYSLGVIALCCSFDVTKQIVWCPPPSRRRRRYSTWRSRKIDL